MGRSISGLNGGGAGVGVAMIYTPSRLYAPPGMGGGNVNTTGVNGLVITPFLLRPGQHRVAGIWLALHAAGGCRLGLWADNGSGRPGDLLKDCGLVPDAPAGLVKASFTPFGLDGGASGRMVHFGATFASAGPLMCRPNSGSVTPATAGATLAEVGLPGDAVGFLTAGLHYDLSLVKGDALSNAALASSPAVAAGSIGMLVGGLIFG